MQPATIEVRDDNYLKSYGLDGKDYAKEIKLETVQLGYRYGNPVEELMYVGYNFDGQKIFQYLVNSVNVWFENK